MTRERQRGGRAAEPATDDEDGVPGGQFARVFVFRLSAVGWKVLDPDYTSATRSGCATALNSRYGSGVSR